MPKLKPYQVAQAGEHLVASELHRRGAYAVTFSGNMPKIDILASDVAQTRTISIQVKTKTAGSWHTSIYRGEEEPVESRFWILVNIGQDPAFQPEYWVVPDPWMVPHIQIWYDDWIARHGGVRPVNPESKHVGIKPENVAEWRDRWDVLGVF